MLTLQDRCHHMTSRGWCQTGQYIRCANADLLSVGYVYTYIYGKYINCANADLLSVKYVNAYIYIIIAVNVCVCVCLFVCPSSNSSKTTGARAVKFCTQVRLIPGSNVIYIS